MVHKFTPGVVKVINYSNFKTEPTCYTYSMRPDKFKAYKLRMAGRSYAEISRLLKMPKSTLSTWFSSLEIPEEAKARILKRTRETSLKSLLVLNKSQTHQAEKRALVTKTNAQKSIGPLSKRDLFMVGISLYWAEGYKRPVIRNGKPRTYHSVRITNSDPSLIKTYMRFLREICGVAEEKISANVRMFDHQDEAYLLDFWQKIVKIPHSQFKKSTKFISISSQRKRPFNILPYGTIQITVNDTSLYHKIMGWIEGLHI